jgi:hypothetical protein
MIGQASSHGWGHGLPLRGRSVVVCGWERVWEALSSTAVWDNETGASIMASATPLVALYEAKALKHRRKGAFEDSDIMRSAHKWPAR